MVPFRSTEQLSRARERGVSARREKKAREAGRNRAGGGHCDIDSLSGQQKNKKKQKRKKEIKLGYNQGIERRWVRIPRGSRGHAGTIGYDPRGCCDVFHVCIRCYDTFVCKRLLTISSVYSRAPRSWTNEIVVRGSPRPGARIRETPSGLPRGPRASEPKVAGSSAEEDAEIVERGGKTARASSFRSRSNNYFATADVVPTPRQPLGELVNRLSRLSLRLMHLLLLLLLSVFLYYLSIVGGFTSRGEE